MLSSLLLLSLAAAPSPWAAAEPLPPPLGRVGDVVSAPVPRESGSSSVTFQLPGCERPQSFNLTRFLHGAAEGGSQVHRYLRERGLADYLFAKGQPLLEAYDGAWKVAEAEKSCAAEGGWRLSSSTAKAARCTRSERLPLKLLFLRPATDSKKTREVRAVVQLHQGDKQTPCLPRISAELFDDAGKPRFRYHADYGGVLSAEVMGDGCDVELRFDPTRQAFLPVPKVPARCASLRKKAGAAEPPRP